MADSVEFAVAANQCSCAATDQCGRSAIAVIERRQGQGPSCRYVAYLLREAVRKRMRLRTSRLRHIEVETVNDVRSSGLRCSNKGLHEIGKGYIVIVQKQDVVRLCFGYCMVA